LYVGAAAQTLELSQQQLGFLAASVAAGSAISSVVMMFLVRRMPWRRLGWAALLLLLMPMIASLFVDDAAGFMALQGLAALGSGSTYSLALTALADSRHPDRAFGLSLAAQVAFQVAGMLLLPRLISGAGLDGLLGLFIAMQVLGLFLVRWLPLAGKALPTSATKVVINMPVLLALGGCFFFFFNVGAVWTYIERMAVLAGFESEETGIALAIGVSFGIPGALLASWCGDRFGRVGPLTVGAVGTVLALGLLNQAMSFATYVLAAALYNFVWNFSLAYQYAAVNAVDPGGRGVAAAPAFHGAGAAVGPALVALYVTQTSLIAVNIAAGIAVTLSLLFFVWAIGLASGRVAPVQET